jgi:uncharacterized glyoxalase superfamily protein PhnB
MGDTGNSVRGIRNRELGKVVQIKIQDAASSRKSAGCACAKLCEIGGHAGTGNDMQTAVAKLSRIAPELSAADLAVAIDYYERRLGFEVAMRMPDGEYAIVERDGVAIHLFQDRAQNHSPAAVHIFTPDLEELYAEFAARGAQITQKIEQKPWGNREFRIKDPFGNELKFTEPADRD